MQIDRITKHWKTTTGGILTALFTCLLLFNRITVEQWCGAIGGIATVVGLLSKDPD